MSRASRRFRRMRQRREKTIMVEIRLKKSHLYHLYLQIFRGQQTKSETEADLIREFFRSTKLNAFMDSRLDPDTGVFKPVRESEDEEAKPFEVSLACVKLVHKLCGKKVEAGLDFSLSEQHGEVTEIFEAAKKEAERKDSETKPPTPAS